MSVVVKQYNALKVLNREKWRKEAIYSQRTDIIKYQQSQMRKGQDENKQTFRSYINEKYADYKYALNSYIAPPPLPDLFVSGDFQTAIYVNIDGQNVNIDSTDEKTPFIKKRYKPFGLQQDNIEKVKIPITNNYTSNVYKEIRS